MAWKDKKVKKEVKVEKKVVKVVEPKEVKLNPSVDTTGDETALNQESFKIG